MAVESSRHLGPADNTNSFNTSNSHNVSTNHNIVNINTGIDDERRQILKWLSPLESHQRHQDVRSERLDGVGDWLLETNEFLKWSGPSIEDGGHHAVLFCSGKPGAGKTYLSSLVIDKLCDRAVTNNLSVTWLYCDSLAYQEQSATNIFGALLKQLVSRREIPKDIQEAFRKEPAGRGPQLPDITEMLRATIALLRRVYICIDALDEARPKHQQELLRSLRDIVRDSSSTRLFLTGRHHVEDEVKRRFTKAIIFPVGPTGDDIRIYLEERLARDPEPAVMDDESRADILKTIPETISEIFLLVHLNIEAILGEMTLHRRKRTLSQMAKGKGLGDAYMATLARVQAQNGGKSELGMKLLMWVSHAERPLDVDELCHALGAEKGSRDLNSDNIPSIKTVLGCSLGLVIVETPSSTVRPVHFTLREHLSYNPGLFQSPHSMIAEACLTYLNFQCVRDPLLTLPSALITLPFLEYASVYWGIHARRETSESVTSLALRLLSGYDEHVSSRLLLFCDGYSSEKTLYSRGNPNGFSGLHGAAYFGVIDIIARLTQLKEWDHNATDSTGSTVISWAARNGHEEVVKMLLEQDNIKLDKADELGRTPLLLAAMNGHKKVVKILLERDDIVPDTPDTSDGWTPLWWAIHKGNREIVGMLLKRNDVNPNTQDTEYGTSPLSFAVIHGYEKAVEILLERNDIAPDTPDTEGGRTPLWWAIHSKRDKAVEMLLKRNDVNPNTQETEYGRTPLSWAVVTGRGKVVKMLLERDDIAPNTPDINYGWTPLLWAAHGRNEEIVEMLLKRNDVNPNTQEPQYGQTPLLLATRNGHEKVVKMLLERDDIAPDTPDTFGQTPFCSVIQEGNEEIVEMLLRRNDVNPNTQDAKYGLSPLSLAAMNGQVNVVKMLLERDDIAPDTPDTKGGRTPPWWAIQKRNEEILEMLLKRSDLNPNTQETQSGQTPPWLAAINGREKIVKVLLERDDSNPEVADILGRTPLFHGNRSRRRRIPNSLLGRKALLPKPADGQQLTEPSSTRPSQPPDLSSHPEGSTSSITPFHNPCSHPIQPDNPFEPPLSVGAQAYLPSRTHFFNTFAFCLIFFSFFTLVS